MKGRKDLVKRILSIVLVSVILLSAGIVNPVSCALTGTVTADAAAKTRERQGSLYWIRAMEGRKRVPAITVCRRRRST